MRISVRDLGADGKSLVRNSGVGVGGRIEILRKTVSKRSKKFKKTMCLAYVTRTCRVESGGRTLAGPSEERRERSVAKP